MSDEKRQTPAAGSYPTYPTAPSTAGYPTGATYPTGAAGYPPAASGGYPTQGYGYGQSPYQTPQTPAYYQPGFQSPVQAQPTTQVPGMLPIEESYIENILRLNKGKLATIYMTFENNTRWNAMVFTGIIEAAGRDHIIISDPETGKRHLLLMVYLDYITFDEELQYEYPYAAGAGLAAYPPR